MVPTDMKEFIALIVVVGIVVYFLCQPTTTPQLERAERARAADRPRANTPVVSATAASANGSLESRWQTGATSPTAAPAASDGSLTNRWKPSP
jgi:hypothetical protein